MARKSVARRKRKVYSKQKKKTTDRRMEYADIPECQDRSYADKEYTTSREEKIWDPTVDVEGWFPGYSLAARTVLILKHEYEGIPIMKAIENVRSGDTEQYISDVLHEANYDPNCALQMILINEMPQRIFDKWEPEEMKLFTEGIMQHGKSFSIIRREMLPHKRVEDFAEFYYVWKRSSMAEDWRKARMRIKAEEREMEEKQRKRSKTRRRIKAEEREMEEKQKKRSNNERVSNPSKNEPACNLSNNRIMTRSAVAAAKHSLQNSGGTDDDSKSSTSTASSQNNEDTCSTTETTDSSAEHVQKAVNGLPETATSEKSPMKNEQISDNSMKCPKQGRKRKLSIPRKMVNFDEKFADEIEEIKCVPAPIIPQWKRQRRFKNTLFNNSPAIYQCDLRFLKSIVSIRS